MRDVNVRPMEKKDIPQASDIHRKVMREGLGQDMNYVIEDLFASFIEKTPKTCLVAEKNNRVVGFIVGCIKEWGFGVERSGWIEMIEVDPGLMGEGIGKTLGEALIRLFTDQGIKEVYTTVKWDSGDLISFFKSIGFDKSGFINLEYRSEQSKN
jgi:ribosomal protein S18 acetylase RimI-like enzyme